MLSFNKQAKRKESRIDDTRDGRSASQIDGVIDHGDSVAGRLSQAKQADNAGDTY